MPCSNPAIGAALARIGYRGIEWSRLHFRTRELSRADIGVHAINVSTGPQRWVPDHVRIP